MNTKPRKRINWLKNEHQAYADKRVMEMWEKAIIADEVLCGVLRSDYHLDDWSDDEIMANVKWLGYSRENAEEDWADWKGKK